MEPEVKAVPAEFAEAIAKVDAARPSQADICDALPEQCAVEVEDVYGAKRIDYKGVPIKNADGTLNRYGKNLIDMHAPAAHAGAEIVDKLRAGDYDDEPEPTAERERVRPLDPDVASRVAERRGLVAVRGERVRGRSVRDASGVRNLWLEPSTGRLFRMAFVGTERSARVETYHA